MASKERFGYGEHHYSVVRSGLRRTTKNFSNMKDALEYYDLQCIRHKVGNDGVFDVMLVEHYKPGSKYAMNWVFISHKLTSIPYRNVYADKKKQPSPFGLLG